MYWTARRTLNRYRPVQPSSTRPGSPAASGEIRGTAISTPASRPTPRSAPNPSRTAWLCRREPPPPGSVPGPAGPISSFRYPQEAAKNTAAAKTIARTTPSRWRIPLNPFWNPQTEAYGETRRTSWPRMSSVSSLSFLGTYAYPQPVHRVKENVGPVGVASGQPELYAARAGREAESSRTPAAEIGGHPVEEFPAAAPRHQWQQRGVMPDRPFEYRRVDRRGYRGTQVGSFGKIIKDLLVGVEDIEVGDAGGGQVGPAARPAVAIAHAVEHADSFRRQQGHRADRNVLVRGRPRRPERDAQATQEVAAEHLAPRRHAQVNQGGMVRERASLRAAQVSRAVARTGRPVRVEVLEVDDQHVGLQSRQGPGHRRQGALRQFVVPVDEPDVLPRRLLRAQVAGGPGTDRGRRADDPQP